MPRLTNRDYLTNRALLRDQWLTPTRGAFGTLPRYAQLDLHQYYAPAKELWDDDAIAHRVAIAKQHPSLPQRAGRAFEALCASIDGTPNLLLDRYRQRPTGTIGSCKKKLAIRITGVANPNPDYQFLVRHLTDLVKKEMLAYDVADPKLKKKMAAKMRARAEKARRRL